MKKLFLFIFSLALILSLCSCNKENEIIDWSNVELKESFPTSVVQSGKILDNNESKLSVCIYNSSEDAYTKLVDKCIKEYGYNINVDTKIDYYSASNSEGYILYVMFNSESKTLNVVVDAPKN